MISRLVNTIHFFSQEILSQDIFRIFAPLSYPKGEVFSNVVYVHGVTCEYSFVRRRGGHGDRDRFIVPLHYSDVLSLQCDAT